MPSIQSHDLEYIANKIAEDETGIDPNDKYWFDKPSVLLEKPKQIIPTSFMSFNEKLNAISRFVIALFLLCLMFCNIRTTMIMLVFTFSALMLTFKHHCNNQKNKKEKAKEIIENFESGNKDDVKIDEFGNICQRPTCNNPFMNPLITDYTLNPNRPPGCSFDDPCIVKEAEDYYNERLFYDIGDLWSKKFADIPFHNVPGSTIPNDRDTWAKWCFNTSSTCKEDPYNCWYTERQTN